MSKPMTLEEAVRWLTSERVSFWTRAAATSSISADEAATLLREWTAKHEAANAAILTHAERTLAVRGEFEGVDIAELCERAGGEE